MPALQSYYECLGVKRTADTDEIKKCFRKAALKTHPERAIGMSKTEAESAFNNICESYEVLSNPAKRAVYDRTGSMADTEDLTDEKFASL